MINRFTVNSLSRGFTIRTAAGARELLNRPVLPRRSPLIAAGLSSAIGGRVLITTDGEVWRNTHDAITGFFTPAYVTQNYLPVVDRIASQTFAAIAHQASQSEAGHVTMDVEKTMRITLTRIMGHVLFGQTLSPKEATVLEQKLDRATQAAPEVYRNPVNVVGNRLFHLIGKPELAPLLLPKHQRDALKEIRRWVRDKVNTALADQSQTGTLIRSLEKRYADLGQRAQKRQISAECALFLFAGVETTAATIANAISQIGRSQPTYDRLVAEAWAAESADRKTLDPRKLLHARHVFDEALRFYSPVRAISRVAGENEQIAGVAVPSGATYQILPHRFHHDEKVWGSPGVFDQDRFSNLTHEQKQSFIPYGAGPQICPGLTLASVEGAVFLARTSQHLVFEAIKGPSKLERNFFSVARPSHISAVVKAAGTFTAT